MRPIPSAKFLEHAGEKNTQQNRIEFFAPRRFVPPYACSIKNIRDYFANAKCNFPVMSIFKVNTIRQRHRCNQPKSFSDQQRHYSEPGSEMY